MNKGSLKREESQILNQLELRQVLIRALARKRDGWRFVASALLTILGIWLVFGVLGYRLAAVIFR